MWKFGLKNKIKNAFEEVGSIKPFKAREIPSSLLSTVDGQKSLGIYSSKEQTMLEGIIKYNTLVAERNEYINFNAEGNKYFKDKYGYDAVSSIYFCKYIYASNTFRNTITPAEYKLSIPDNIVELVNNTKVMVEDIPCEIWSGSSHRAEEIVAYHYSNRTEKVIEDILFDGGGGLYFDKAKGVTSVKCYYIQKNNTAIGVIMPLQFKGRLFHTVVFP